MSVPLSPTSNLNIPSGQIGSAHLHALQEQFDAAEAKQAAEVLCDSTKK